MKTIATRLFLILGLLSAVPAAHAGGTNDMDSFWAIQRGYGYDKGTQPMAPGAFPMGSGNGWNDKAQPAIPDATGSIPVPRPRHQTIHPSAKDHARPAKPSE